MKITTSKFKISQNIHIWLTPDKEMRCQLDSKVSHRHFDRAIATFNFGIESELFVQTEIK